MDIWVVAAAAGAGYVVQHLKSLTRSKSCPFGRVLSGQEMSRERKKVCEAAASDLDIASTSGYKEENRVLLDNFASYSTVSDSALLNNKDFEGNWEGRLPSDGGEDFTSDLSLHPSSSGIGFSCNSRRKRSSSLKSRGISSQLIKPRTSLESCLMAQLYEEDAEIEEHTYSLHPLQKPTVRPFLVTDGSRVISSAPLESFSETTGTRTRKCQLSKGAYSQENKTVCGVPTLPDVVPVELQKKSKTRNGKEHVFRRIDSRKIGLRNQDNAKGTSDMALLFYLGLTMGMMSSFLANKQEVEKLKNLLKQRENLVQDLQEELEMKDSVIVNELAAEDYESQGVHNDHCFDDDAARALPLEPNFSEEYYNQKAEEKSLSNIEAELEAELQMLESHINSSSLEGKLCNLAELDPELVSDVNESNQLYADRDGSRGSTPRSARYPVSPRDLSLRLHQVIQSRLEERVKELEMALENSQRKVKCMESQRMLRSRELSNNEEESLIAGDGQQSLDQPVIINLSGEALAAYNEAYGELTKVSISDEEDVQVVFEDVYHVENGDTDHQQSASVGNPETVFDRRTEEDVYSVWSSSRDEIEVDDELIRQIIEKAKQGSPAILKAQRALLLSTDEN